MAKRKNEFLQTNHGSVGYGYKTSKRGHIDTWRKREFPGLVHPIAVTSNATYKRTAETTAVEQEENNLCNSSSIGIKKTIEDLEVYLDYAGSSIPSLSLLNDIHSLSSSPQQQIIANPHSSGIAAARSKEGIEMTKKKLLDFFHAQPGPLYGFQHEHKHEHEHEHTNSDSDCYHPGYDVIFTSGATESLRIVAENFQWMTGRSNISPPSSSPTSSPSPSVFVYPMNSHTSVVGMRECALANGASFRCVKASTLFNADCTMFHEWASNTHHNNDTPVENYVHYHPKQPQYDTCDTPLPNQYENEHEHEHKHEHDDDSTNNESDNLKDNKISEHINHLLVIPLECNFSGLKPKNHAKDIIQSSRNCCSDDNLTRTSKTHHQWYTMLDIAKAACTQSINLKRIDPDFACVSFYKIFGYPTGIGALFIKRSSMHVLLPPLPPSLSLPKMINDTHSSVHTFRNSNEERRYFGGGAVDIVLPGTDFVSLRSSSSNNGNSSSSSNNNVSPSIPSNVFVPGTINFRAILSLQPCVDEIYSIGGMEQISYHTKSLAFEAVRRLGRLQHTNGQRAIIIYGPWSSSSNKDNKMKLSNRSDNVDSFETMVDKMPGPTISFNIIRHDGSFVGYNEVAKLASLYKHPIQFRTGCFCNPGACQEALQLTDDDVKQNFLQGGHVCGDEIDIINGKPTGAVRISFGKDSIWEDLDSLVVFLEKTFVSYDCRTDGCKEVELIASEASLQTEVTLSEMYIYPIKSCAAMRVSKWKLDRETAAFQYDREFALVDSSGSALRLSTYPKMGLIRPSIDLDTEALVVKGDGFPDLVIDLRPLRCTHPMSKEIKVCGNRCGGILWGSHGVSQWFSSLLGVQCWLARYNGTAYISSSEANGGTKISSYSPYGNTNAVRTGFENEAPILLISQHSVDLLNTILQSQGSKPVNSKYFRPNFVVDIPLKNASSISNPEDFWSKILVPRHNLRLTMIGQCARCSMVDIDPTSGSKGGKTLRALAEYRRDKGRINFGIFLSSSRNEDKIFSDDDQKEVMIEQGERLIIKY